MCDLFPNKSESQIRSRCRKFGVSIGRKEFTTIGNELHLKCSRCHINKPYNNDNFILSTNKAKCRDCFNKEINITKWKNKHGIILDFEKMYDTYSPITWYKMFRDGKFKKMPLDIMEIEKCIEIVKFIFKHELNCKTREDVLKVRKSDIKIYISEKVMNVINTDYIKLVKAVFPEYQFKTFEFSQFPKGYIRVRKNADEYMRYVVLNVIDKMNISDYKRDIPHIFKFENLQELGFNPLIHCVSKYKHYHNYYEWLSSLYPEWNLTEQDFDIVIAADNKTVLDSSQEKCIFDFIYLYFNTNIKGIGRRRTNGFINQKASEVYYPDFKITKINNNEISKPIYIEYYGLYKDEVYESELNLYKGYREKTERKNVFFKNMEDIYFIDLYPSDLKNGFRGVKEKLMPFLNKLSS